MEPKESVIKGLPCTMIKNLTYDLQSLLHIHFVIDIW